MSTPNLPPLPHMPRDKAAIVKARDRIFLAEIERLTSDRDSWLEQAMDRLKDWDEMRQEAERLLARVAELEADAERLDYIERTFAGCTTQERYLPIRMIWGKGCNGRTLREACDKYMARDAARGAK